MDKFVTVTTGMPASKLQVRVLTLFTKNTRGHDTMDMEGWDEMIVYLDNYGSRQLRQAFDWPLDVIKGGHRRQRKYKWKRCKRREASTKYSKKPL
jgi:hypothetical protein